MIELKKVNKYFNKGKKNSIHVINNTTLNLKNGLVALLGPSGCGKTTLLNAIGGLDKIKSGSIYIDNQKISSNFLNKVDKIRTLNIGYIFQDYKLLDNLSVFENVSLALTMIGLKDKKEIRKRVDYVLDKVGMSRYRLRPASMLSGGQRQRVAIARAIVKNPDIILADEPTGNLDSKNSLEVMKIIKAISKDKLVILVTHEENLAKFYASRVIQIEDGKIINDYVNDHERDLDYEIENSLYLKDFTNCENLPNNITIYSNNKENLDLQIVVKKGNIYIKSTKNIEVVDDNSSIEFIDDHYKKIAKSDIDKYEFNFKNIINDNFKKKYSSIFNPITLITNGFKKVLNMSFLKKILLIGFFLSGMFIMYSVSSVSATLKVEDKDFVTKNKNYLEVLSSKLNVNDYLEYEKDPSISYLIPGNSIVNFNVKYDYYYQTSKMNDTLKASIFTIETIKESDLLYGVMPTNDKEVVVDILAIKNMFEKENMAKMSGIIHEKDLLNKEISINNMDSFKIVGITDLNSPSIYLDKVNFINVIANNKQEESVNSNSEESSSDILDYNLLQNKITIREGRSPSNDYEVIVNISNKEAMPINKEIPLKVNDKKLTVVGYYYSKDNYNNYLVNNNMIKYNLITTNRNITIYSNDKEKTLSTFRNKNINIKDSYLQSRSEYLEGKKESNENTLLLSGIILLISLIEIYLMIRASFLSRIKEIGIYRAIGVKKLDIYKMFASEVFAITTMASVPGLVLMSYILDKLSTVKYLTNRFLVNPEIVVISLIFIYLFNLVIGLFPVFNTIRKRPSVILARTDLD